MKKQGFLCLYDDLFEVLDPNNETLYSGDEVNPLELTKSIEGALFNHYNMGYKFNTDEEIIASIPFVSFKNPVQFEKNTSIKLIDFESKLDEFDQEKAWKYYPLYPKAPYNTWTVDIRLDELPYCIEKRYAVAFMCYVWHDHQIHIKPCTVGKNFDWSEFIDDLMVEKDEETGNLRFSTYLYGNLPEKGISKFFFFFADIDTVQSVFDLYEGATCGICIDIKNSKMTVYDRNTAIKIFHNLCEHSHEAAWIPNCPSIDDLPDECKDLTKSEKLKASSKDGAIEEIFEQCVITPRGERIFLDLDWENDKAIKQIEDVVNESLRKEAAEQKNYKSKLEGVCCVKH